MTKKYFDFVLNEFLLYSLNDYTANQSYSYRFFDNIDWEDGHPYNIELNYDLKPSGIVRLFN